MTIKRIVVMHGHGDHYGGADHLHQLSGAPVYMSDADGALTAREFGRAAVGPARGYPPRMLAALADATAGTKER